MIEFDLNTKTVIPNISAKQGDTDRSIQFSLIENGTPYNPSADALSCWYDGASGEGNYDTVDAESAFSIIGNVVTMKLHPNMMLNAGKVAIAVTLNRENGKISTWNITMNVERTPGIDSEEAGEYYEAFRAGSLAQEIAAVNQRVSNIIAGEVTSDTEITDARISHDGYQSTTLGDSIRFQAERAMKQFNDLRVANGTQLVDYNSLPIYHYYAGASAEKPVTVGSTRSGFIIPIDYSQGQYVTAHVSKLSVRFQIATYPSFPSPTDGTVSINEAHNNSNTATEKTLTVPVANNAKYLMVTYHFGSSSGDSIPAEEIAQTLMVQYGQAFTGYEPYWRPTFVDAINDESKRAIGFVRNLTSSDNVDTIDESGVYFCSVSNDPQNLPARNSYLIVAKAHNVGTQGRCVQICVTSNDPSIVYVRTGNTHRQYTKWEKLVTESTIAPYYINYFNYANFVIDNNGNANQSNYNSFKFRSIIKDNQYAYIGSEHLTAFPFHMTKIDASKLERPSVVSKVALEVQIGGTSVGLADVTGSDDKKMSVVDMVMNGNYIYAAVRGGTGAPPDKTVRNGLILVIDKTDFHVVQTIERNSRVTTVSLYGNYVAFGEQLGGFSVWKIGSNSLLSDSPVYEYHAGQSDGEWLQSDWYTVTETAADDSTVTHLYLVFGSYTHGVRIYEVAEESDSTTVTLVSEISISSIGSNLNCFAVNCNYPYVYATISPLNDYRATNQTCGIAVIDVSNLSSPTMTFTQIPASQCGSVAGRFEYSSGSYRFSGSGDPAPAFIKRVGNRLFATNEDRGIALFNIGGGGATVAYQGNMDCEDWPKQFDVSSDGKVIFTCGYANWLREKPDGFHVLYLP